MSILKIIIAIIIFSIIIIFHELGHFLFAKLNGIRVNEFSLGLGPTIIGFTKGETKYSLKLLPFGGACMMEGEDEESDDSRSFNSKKPLQRFSVIFAGPAFNFIMAFIFSLIIIGCIGVDKPVIGTVMDGYPAQEAGIETGDTIKQLNSTNVYTFRDITLYLLKHSGEEIRITYERDGEEEQTTIVPVYDEETSRYMIGFYSTNIREKVGALQTIRYSFHEVRYWISYTLHSLFMLVTGEASLNDMSGPVGIIQTIGDTYETTVTNSGFYYAILSLLNISVLLSANLGVINLLPLPALDGGRILFIIIEAIRRKRIDPNKEGIVHFIGFMILIVFIVVVMFNDIRKLIESLG
ncbi:MAG: RIP metalloprotease RseP [Eubacterium sp.]|nr:RIP metalloprotease RseP [Eubacterium sp.]